MEFRQYHLCEVLKSMELQHVPLDAFLSHYFRSHRALGSKDRHWLAETVYHYIRWQPLYRHLNKEAAESIDPLLSLNDDTIPLHIRYGMGPELFQLLADAYGEEKAKEISLISNGRAPLTIRINPLKTSREALQQRWSSHCATSPCQFSPLGLHVHERINFFTLPEFKEGLFEIQDESSQLAAQLVRAKPKHHVLDHCAGAGGKTLAFAHRLENRGQIYLHDIRPHALQKARQRASRAGVQNVQFNLPPSKQSVDWVVADVPCSGTGTLRRNPDLKWRFDTTKFDALLNEQRAIFREALDYLNPTGHIVYMTCSVLPQENEEQATYFQNEYNLTVVETFKTLPLDKGMDGFYAVCFTRSKNRSMVS